MTIKVGDRIPDAKLYESADWNDETNCPLRPTVVSVAEAVKSKKIAVFGLPGAFTPTCSAKHVPSYVAGLDALKAKGVNEVWCVAVNDGYVMQAWGRQEKATGKIRMLGDGNGDWTKELGLELDSTGGGMGLRMRRFSMLVDDGMVMQLNIEAPGKFEVSDAETLLKQLG